MKALFFILLLIMGQPHQDTQELIYNFGKDGDNADWIIVNDGVMGGLSEGSYEQRDSTVLFYGDISLLNNGGFSSFRTKYGKYDLSPYDYVTIRARGKGQSFGFSLKLTEPFYDPYFRVNFRPTDEWQEYTFKLSDFEVWQMSEAVGEGMPAKYKSEIVRLNFINADKKAGPFELELDYIKFY